MKHLVICGHGQGRNNYDVGAVNKNLNINEANKVREFASLMSKFSSNINYIYEYDVYNFGNYKDVSRGYDSVTELHFNAFNKTAKGAEVLIHNNLQPDTLDNNLMVILSDYFVSRGIKKVGWLYNCNIALQIGSNYRLVEICFIDNDSDMAIYERNKIEIAKRFVEVIEKRVITKETIKETNEENKEVEDMLLIKFEENLDGFKKDDILLLNFSRGTYHHVGNIEELNFIRKQYPNIKTENTSKLYPCHIRYISGFKLNFIK